MIKLLTFIILTSAAVILGPMLADTQGYVHISTTSHVIETSITTAFTVYLFSLITIFIVYFVVKKIISIPKGALKAFRVRAKIKNHSIQDEAIIKFEQGEYERVLSLLEHADPIEHMTEKSLLIAAQAAFFTGNYEFTRQALNEAESRGKDARIAANIIRAKLNYKIGNVKAALEFLDKNDKKFLNQNVLKLYYDCYNSLNDLEKLQEITPHLLKFKVIDEQQAHEIYVRQVEAKLTSTTNVDELNKVLKKLPKADKKDPKIMGAFAYKFIHLGDANKAREIAMDILKVKPDSNFLESVSRWDIAIPDVLSLLKKYAQKNLITSQINQPLLKAIANLEFKSGLLRESLDDFNQALSISPSSDIYMKMGAICSALQNYTQADEYYSKANAIINEKKALQIK